MKFIKKKNMQEGEELLYVPQLHWMYVFRHVVFSSPFFLVSIILWRFLFASHVGWLGGLISALIIRNTLLFAALIVLVILVFRILSYMGTEYGVTNQRLIIKKGNVPLSVGEIPTDRIESIFCYQGLLGRIFRYGTISIIGVGGTLVPVFEMVHKPFALRRKIVDIIEKNKVITVVHGDLPKPAPVIEPEPEPVEEPVYRYGTFVRVLSGE